MSDPAANSNTPSPSSNAAGGAPATHPPAIWFFFWGEFAERSSYYGMRAILFMYMTSALHLADTKAAPIYAAFKMGAYLLPLLGGLIADRWIGRYWTIVGFSVPYVLGHFVLGFSDPTILGNSIQGMSADRVRDVAQFLLFVSLALLAGGSGVIKPNISSLLGQTYDQKRPGQERLRSSAFLWFYLAINIGALISQLSLPLVRDRYIMAHLDPDSVEQAKKLIEQGEDIARLASAEVVGRAYQLAFAFPTILMAVSLAIFAAGKKTYADEKAARQNMTSDEKRQGLAMLLFILGIYGLFALYFVFDQFALKKINPDWRRYAQASAIGVTLAAVVALIAYSVLAAGKRAFAAEILDGRNLTAQQQRFSYRTLAYLLSIFALVVFFWFGYEHNDTLWIAFTRDYANLKVPLVHHLTGKQTIAPDQLQFLNALWVIILVPTFNTAFKYLDPNVKIFTPMRKILTGFFLTASAIGIMAVAGYLVQGQTTTIAIDDKITEVCPESAKVSWMWTAMAYIVLTFGEVLLYGTMLDLSYSAAPKSMKGYVTACFLLTNTLANFLNILWTPFYGGSLPDPLERRGPLPPGLFFAITAGVTVVAGLLFVLIGKLFQRSQAEEAASRKAPTI